MDKVVADATGKIGTVAYVTCRKALAELKPVARGAEKMTWRMKSLVLANRIAK